MRDSKQGINTHPRRFMANISSVYRKQPSVLDFTQEFINMAKSGSGERGLFNLVAARKRTPKRRDAKKIIITNPCGETLLRNRGLCNLSEVVIRAEDDFDSIQDKIK
jgi:ribonucleoside-diphosphate reductase alpha chain